MFWQRVATILVLAPLVLALVLWGPNWAIAAVMTVLIAGGAWEWTRLMNLKPDPLRWGFVLMVLVDIGLIWWQLDNPWLLWVILLPAAAWWLLAFVWILVYPKGLEAEQKAWRRSALVGFVVLLPCWYGLVALHKADPWNLLYVLLLIWAADIGAYLAGKQFGKHKLAPHVSPGKSWEGVAGAIVASSIAAVVAAIWLYQLDVLMTVAFVACSLLVAIWSIVGDLTESMFKRHSGHKDSGNVFPGHGGILDRIDSLCAAAPLFMLTLWMLGVLA